MFKGDFKLLEELVGHTLSPSFKEFLAKYAGLGIEEEYFLDDQKYDWIVATFCSSKDMYDLTREFMDSGWGKKIPFAYDEGGWHFCLCFDDNLFEKIVINRWTDYDVDEQFVVIADDFDDFINRLTVRPE